MKNSVLYCVAAVALLAANSKAHAQGLFGLFENAPPTPVAAAREVASTTAKLATQGVAETANAGREIVYLAGDGSETVYEYHPGARVGRKVGVLPHGKLGLLPSHDTAAPETGAQSSETGQTRQGADTAMHQAPDDERASTTPGVQPSTHAANPPHRATRPRRSRGFVSRLFRFGRR